MRKIKGVVILLILVDSCFTATADAELAITEIMSQSVHEQPTNCDWWELTNTGPSAVDLTGYSWDDDHKRPGQNVFGSITIAAGESIIIRDTVAAPGDPWKEDWGLGAEVNVYDPSYFSGSFSSLGSSDGVFLYEPNNALITFVEFPSRTAGFSNEWAMNGTFLGLSVVGENGAYQSTNLIPDVASPGYAVQSEPCSSSGRMMYWTDKDSAKIQRVNLESGCVEDILTSADGLVEPRGLAIDVAGEKMYWADSVTGVIHRSNLDGSVDVQIVTGLSLPADIALDTDNGKIYFAESGLSRIRRVNIDGSELIEDVVSGLGQPYYIELDLTNSRIYWSDVENSVIHRANLDGSGSEDFITGLNHVRDIVLDLSAGRIYWGDRGSSKIQRANLDGTGGIEDLFGPEDGLGRPHGLLLDADEDMIYWTDTITSAIHRANADGSGPVEDLVTGLDGPWALAIVMVREIKYVDADAAGENDGSSWEDAFNYLRDALSTARPGDEIWVAEGIYKPDEDTDNPDGTGSREATFQLKIGVAVKGGYAGYGQPDPDKRDIETFETILSGDLDGNDVDVNDPCDLLTEPTRSENSYHIVTGSNIDETAVLDGFTITGGNANGSPDFERDRGGGMFNNGHDNRCNPTVTRCTFVGNSAAQYGGGMFNYGHGDGECNPILTNCAFIHNASGGEGGAMSSWEGHSVVTNCTFGGNYSHDVGGGMGNAGSNPTVRNCTFSDNSTNGGGGGMWNYYSSPLVIDSIFRANSADGGGGMYNVGTYSSPTLTNCTFSGNLAQNNGGGLYNLGVSSPRLTNCILWGNNDSGGMDESAQIFGGTPVVTYSCIQGLNVFMGDDNIGDDPLFLDADGADDIPGTSDDNLRLTKGSPCIDSGNNAAVPAQTQTDLAGHRRIIDGDCNGTAIVDMGVYEFNYAYMGDFDYNCQMNFSDFAMFALVWLTEPGDVRWNPTCDISIPADNSVDMLDLNVFVENWLADIE